MKKKGPPRKGDYINNGRGVSIVTKTNGIHLVARGSRSNHTLFSPCRHNTKFASEYQIRRCLRRIDEDRGREIDRFIAAMERDDEEEAFLREALAWVKRRRK